jgi:hypothetical protein
VKYLILAGSLLLTAACHQKNPSDDPATGKGNTDTVRKDYFPVLDYLNGEISYIENTPLLIVKYNIEGKKTDSSFISPLVFHQLAAEFLAPELDSTFFNAEYKENSFVDETTKMLNFTFSTDNKKLALQTVDVLANHAVDGNEKISGVYMEKREDRNDSLVIKKMYWQTGRQFQIVTMISPKGQPSRTLQLKVVWAHDE